MSKLPTPQELQMLKQAEQRQVLLYKNKQKAKEQLLRIRTLIASYPIEERKSYGFSKSVNS
jgi:hypothetical protein